MDGLLPFLIPAVVALVALNAWVGRNRSGLVEEEDDPDNHVLRSDYQSGMGGGAQRTWKVPKDPDAYARLFVPKDKD
ncbi:hypothetical protein J7382_04805 [Shimia sp. R11_0]|uniref:hypothetical protein n=1 Tax=Shimia sp. R11_0 TaxID=2821096 RepID=UPI001ADB5E8A|nr:hypothetical protein [Shimia sp. R11_0]MBO9476849.1 hypothetical protein [Shimia sp. R11_0]